MSGCVEIQTHIIHIIQREAPRCSFYSEGHMPEPRFVGRATGTDPRALFLYNPVGLWAFQHLNKHSPTMKRFIIGTFTVVFLAFFAALTVNASEETKKTRKEQKAELRKEFDAKASKKARQRAKELKKDHWQLFGAGSTFEDQLERAWRYQEPNEDGEIEYIVESGTGTGKNRNAAQNAAKMNARSAIGKTLESEIGSLIEGNLNNSVMSEDEALTQDDMNEVYTSFMQQKLKKAIVVSEWYRKTDAGTYQVDVTMALRIATFKEELNELWKRETKEKNEQMHKKLSEKLENNNAK